jgi:hypothetical protein
LPLLSLCPYQCLQWLMRMAGTTTATTNIITITGSTIRIEVDNENDRPKLCRRVRLRTFYLALGLKPIVQIVTVCFSALVVKFVGALPNLLLDWDRDSRLVRLRCEC